MPAQTGTIIAADLAELRPAAIDYEETEALKAMFARLRREHDPLYLTGCEFDRVLRWKLRGHYPRQRERRRANTPGVIETVTGAALTISHEDPDYDCELRVGILCALRGVGAPVASAILTLAFPERYAVIDFRVWRKVFGERRGSFSIRDYKRYPERLRELADELGWPVQESTWRSGSTTGGSTHRDATARALGPSRRARGARE